MSEAKFDPHRRLCPDGACIGVIGSDGHCRVCGRSASGKEAAPADFVPAAEGDDEDEREGEDEVQAEVQDGKAAAGAGGFDPKRRLCSDGSCLGVIGADGICNVCGRQQG
jgi:hypothetical protein